MPMAELLPLNGIFNAVGDCKIQLKGQCGYIPEGRIELEVMSNILNGRHATGLI